MSAEQNWRTESYKGMEVHVSAIPHEKSAGLWDFTVRVAQPGEDTSAASEITAQAGDEADYPTPEAAVQAGFVKGYALVDLLLD